MSGGQVAYHLRPNKAIERQVFVELLTRFHGFRAVYPYTYVGFGGPFMEDFRLIEGHFGVARMISLEGDAAVIERQKFNRPFTSIDCRKQLSGDFIANYASEHINNAIVWLDYAQANARRAQLGEFQSLLEKLRAFDIVKITMNANPSTLSIPQDTPPTELQRARLEAAERQLGDFWPAEVAADDMTRSRFPRVLLHCVLRAARQALPPGRDVTFVPLTSFSYADSEHVMLTVSGVLSPLTDVPRMRRALRFGNWDLAYRESNAPIPIAAPVLSTRERAFLERLLPRYRRSIASRSKFQVAERKGASEELLTSFARFSRYYPHFARILP